MGYMLQVSSNRSPWQKCGFVALNLRATNILVPFLFLSFGVVNSLIGFRLGGKGQFLLERAQDCFKRSQLIIPRDGVVANVYLRLLVSALNNELFCLLELGLYDESCSCLHQMIDLLQFCGPTTFVGRDDFERQILLNLLVLSKRHILAAAA